MNRYALFSLSILLPVISACTDTDGISRESTRPPKGNPNSSIVVVEYADLQCPACQGAHEQISTPLLEEYGSVIRFEMKHFPLRRIHPYAQEAAEAAECAADQGKFWEFVDDIYASRENQSKLKREDHLARAETIGIADVELFERCMDSRIKRDVVQKDYEDGIEREVNSTPSFFVAGERVQRNNLELIKSMIEDKVGSQRL